MRQQIKQRQNKHDLITILSFYALSFLVMLYSCSNTRIYNNIKDKISRDSLSNVIKIWNKDTFGCEGKRFDVEGVFINYFWINKNRPDKMIKIWGKPDQIFGLSSDTITYIYITSSSCPSGKFDDNYDYCYLRVIYLKKIRKLFYTDVECY